MFCYRGAKVIYEHTNGDKIPAEVVRVCADRKHVVARIRGWVGEHWVAIDFDNEVLLRADSPATRARMSRNLTAALKL